MRKSLKIVTVAAVVFMALGAVAFAYAYSQNVAMADASGQQTDTENDQTYFGNCTIRGGMMGFPMSGRMRGMPQMGANGLQWSEGLLQNATLSTVQGTVVSEVKGMLVLDTGSSSGEIRVSLPKDWTVGNEVVGRAELFNGTFASPGQSVTIKVLESDVFTNSSFSINVMMGYEAINATATHAYAVLPFNIQPNS